MSVNRIRDETIRYLGVKSGDIDESLQLLILQAIERVECAAKKQYCVRRVACSVADDGVCLGTHGVVSAQLADHLDGCEEAFLFAATLGPEVDRLLRRDTVAQPSLAVAEHAAAAAVIEQYCDEVCTRLASSLDGAYCRPRFSAGYEDFSLSEQSYMIRALDAAKRIGLTCTDLCMLTPSKSVTAVIGISKEFSRCYARGCDCCSKTDCAFRRKDDE